MKIYTLQPKAKTISSTVPQQYISINDNYLTKRILLQFTDTHQIYFDYNTDGTNVSFHKQNKIDENIMKPTELNELQNFISDPLFEIEAHRIISQL